MPEPNEIVVIELSPEGRMRLSNQILRGMDEMGFTPFHYDALDLGFYLSAAWPTDPAVEITLAQLVVLMQKLKMRLADHAFAAVWTEYNSGRANNGKRVIGQSHNRNKAVVDSRRQGLLFRPPASCGIG